MKILGNNILIEKKKKNVKESKSIIITPDEKSLDYGVVLQLGDKVPEDSPIKVGDEILWAAGIMGVLVNTVEGERVIMRSEDVVAIL